MLAWILSFTSVIVLWLMGNKSKWGPRIGILNQILWIVYSISLREWGLLPGVIMYTIVHIRNLKRWENG